MTELDRIAKRQVARARAREAQDRRSAAAFEAARLAVLEQQIHVLAAESIALLEAQHNPGWTSMRVLRYRFPPFGDLFGDWNTIKAGWDLGHYGSQPIALLSDGRICWCGRVRPLAEIQHCVPLIHARLSSLKTHLSGGEPADEWSPN
jgi:hypothetical protein